MPDPNKPKLSREEEEELEEALGEVSKMFSVETAFLPALFSKKRRELPDYQPNSNDLLVATVKPFIYFRNDGTAYWCEGGEIEMRNLRFEVVEDVDPDRIKIQATVESRLRLLGETTEPWIRNEKDVPGEEVE